MKLFKQIPLQCFRQLLCLATSLLSTCSNFLHIIIILLCCSLASGIMLHVSDQSLYKLGGVQSMVALYGGNELHLTLSATQVT